MEQQFEVIIDTREQKPCLYSRLDDPNFPGLKIRYETLKTGDYSLVGMSDPTKDKYSVCVERKSISDLFGTLGFGRKRFEKELYRMSQFDYACIVIENDYREIFDNPPELSRMLPKSVFRSLIAYSQRFDVHIFPATNRSFAEKTIYLILKRFYDDRTDKNGKLNFDNI